MESTQETSVACSGCFSDRGLRLDAEQIGRGTPGACPNCGARDLKKLSIAGLETLAHRFFVWGSLWKVRYGAAPLVQFNQHQKTSISVASWLAPDVQLFERLLKVGFFHYGPRMWMIGEVEPLKALQRNRARSAIVARVLAEYPTKTIATDDSFYRIRVNPADAAQYDSPPQNIAGRGRLDSPGFPVLYGSTDLELCVHECRVTAEDDLYVATLAPTKNLRLLDLSVLPKEEHVTEFESLDMSVHMLFLAGRHSYKITRLISAAAHEAGFDGIVYPSYFSLLRIGQMPFQTVYGISHRRIPPLQEYEMAKAIPNLALFGRPISDGQVSVQCINRMMITKVSYGFHFGLAAV